MKNKKRRGQVWIETVIYTIIGLALIGTVLAFIAPKISETKDRITIEQSIEAMQTLDAKVQEVIGEGTGNKRNVPLFELKRGHITIDSLTKTVALTINDLNNLYSEPGVPVDYGKVQIVSKKNQKKSEIDLILKYDVLITYGDVEVQQKVITASSTPLEITIESKKNIEGKTYIDFVINNAGGEYYSLPKKKNYLLSILVEGDGRVKSDVEGIDCYSKCSKNFDSEKNIILTASASGGSIFNEWSGACSGDEDTCAIEMDNDKDVVAKFSVESKGDGEGASKMYYVREGAGGKNDGSDWTNAYTSLPLALERGATYYIADGNYGAYTFDDAESGAQYITIKKATQSDHGVETGWLDSFGDGQASFGKIIFDSSYWIFDGNSAAWSYGFIVSGASSGRNVGIGTGVDEIVDSVAIKGVSINSNGVAGVRGLQISKASNVLIENVETWNNDNDCVQMSSGQGVVFDHFRCHTRNDAGAGTHGDAFELATSPPTGGLKNVLRYSIIDWKGQQVFFGGTGTPPDHGAWDIYGNLFINSEGSPGASTKGLTDHDNPQSIGPLNVYNNVFEGLYLAHDWDERTSGNAFNNIYYNLNSLSNFGNVNHDYNYFDSALGSLFGEANGQSGANPFVNRSAKDYHLTKATNSGYLLLSPYNIDIDGKTRGVDGVWDRGAYEYG